MDLLSPEQRSWNMSRIRSKNTKPERIVAAFLRENGIGYRRNLKDLPGKPDFVLTRYHSVIFVNGCFWHGHTGCKYATIPKTRTQWWVDKISQTKERDGRINEELSQLGWRVFTIWECELGKDAVYHLNQLLKDILMSDEYENIDYSNPQIVK